VGELGGHACVGAITVALVASLERRGVKDAASWIPWTSQQSMTMNCGCVGWGSCPGVYN
jgi:hypothetical protein